MSSRSVFMVLFFAFSVQFMGCRPRQEAPNEAKLSETASAPDSAAVASPAIPQHDALVMLSTCLDESSPAANEWAGRYFADVQRHGPLCSSLAGERALLDADTISRCQSAYDAALSQALPSSLVQSAKDYIDAYAVLVPLVQKAAQLFSSAALLSDCDDALALHEHLALAFEQYRRLDEHFSLERKAAP
ncbi:MAG: hypothetical protein RBU37_01200, partial [Myxococcota bacterium]|nr:hypothetical protein [Myxococcota bacterium]